MQATRLPGGKVEAKDMPRNMMRWKFEMMVERDTPEHRALFEILYGRATLAVMPKAPVEGSQV